MPNPNILSERYATEEINSIFSEENIALAERSLWIEIMKAQRRIGMEIPAEDIEKYVAAKSRIDLELIKEIEKRTRHDVKARIEAFVRAAGAGEYIHLGMTSRDLTDNVEQMQLKQAARIIFGKYLSVLRHLVDKSKEYKQIVLTARTHHQPAQPTLLGRRFSMWAEELLIHLHDFEAFINNYPLRGVNGAVGTQSDMLELLGTRANVEELNQIIATSLGFSRCLASTGQVYPRSLDYKLVSMLSLLASACEGFAKTMRLMCGYELLTEGFKPGQVGSSAMPHKMNTRSCERICALAELLKMYADGASRIAGDQWEEGDVSCSALRRVVLPDAFYCSDGLCETTLTVLNEMGPYPAVIERELKRYLPFLATTKLLMLAVKAGLGREEAHEAIKRHAVKQALEMREGREPRFAEGVADDSLFRKAGMTREKIKAAISDTSELLGNAEEQIEVVAENAGRLINKYKKESAYEPRGIV